MTETSQEVCRACEAPTRTLWPPAPDQPRWEESASREWMALVRCRRCERLWARVPHEPFASFPYAVLWPYDPSDWESLHDADSGQSLHAWHLAAVAEAEPTLAPGDRELVREHRRRSKGRAPFPEGDPPGTFDLISFRKRVLGGDR